MIGWCWIRRKKSIRPTFVLRVEEEDAQSDDDSGGKNEWSGDVSEGRLVVQVVELNGLQKSSIVSTWLERSPWRWGRCGSCWEPWQFLPTNSPPYDNDAVTSVENITRTQLKHCQRHNGPMLFFLWLELPYWMKIWPPGLVLLPILATRWRYLHQKIGHQLAPIELVVCMVR